MDWGKRATDQGKEDPQVILARVDERLKAVSDKLDDYIHSNKGNLLALNSKINKEIEDLEHKVDNKVTLLLDRDEKIILDALKIRDQVFIGIGVLSCVVVVIGWALNFLKH